MRRLCFLIVPTMLALCNPGVCASAQNARSSAERMLTLEEMFQMAEQNNSSMKAHATAVAEARQGIKVARTAILPSIDAKLSLSYNGDGTILDRDFGNSFKAEIPDFGNNFSLEVSQVIYSGGAISSKVKMSELRAQLSELAAENNRQGVRFLIIGRCLELCKIDNQLQVLESNIRQTELVLKNMRSRHEQGTALLNDITRYELQMQNLEYMRTQLSNARLIQNSQLAVALGMTDKSVKIKPHNLLTSKPHNLTTSQPHNLQIQMAEKMVSMSEQKKRQANSERMPKVALFAFNQLNGPVTIEIPAIDKNFNYWGVGVGVSYSLGNLYKTNKKVKAERLAVKHANEQLQVAKEQTALALEEANIKYAEAQSLYETKQKSVQLATENYKVVDYRYANGLALITDLLDASAQKLDAEMQAVNARINILFNYYKIKYVEGRL